MVQCCDHCGKEGATKRCSKCRAVVYCDRDCQLAGWKGGHKKTCSAWTCLTNIPAAAGGGKFVVAAGCYKNQLVLVRGTERKDRNCECWTYNVDAKEWARRRDVPASVKTAADGLIVRQFMYVVVYTPSGVRTLRLNLEREGSDWEERAFLGRFRAEASVATDGESYIYLSGGYRLADLRNPMIGQIPLSSVARLM